VVTIVTDVRVPADAFPLGRILRAYPTVEIELERLVPTRQAIIPLFWVASESETPVEATLSTDPLVEGIHKLTRTSGRSLYAVDWSPDVDGLIGLFVDLDIHVMAADGTADAWEFRLQFRNRARLSAFRRSCQEQGINLELLQLYNPMMPKEGGVLSSAEHDVLAVAYENGYFNTPREITQRELADLVGISENAVSKQLRTAIKLVVEEKLYGPGGEPYL
jgi:hypothetical protein